MGQKTKKSPTPSTAKKTGAELPKGSPKGTPSSLPPAAIARLEEVRGLDPNLYHDPMQEAEREAQARVGALLGNEGDVRACAVMDAFLLDAMRRTPPEEILRRATTSEALEEVLLASRRARWQVRRNPSGGGEDAPASPPEPRPLPFPSPQGEGLVSGLAELERRNLAFEEACHRAFSREEACGVEERAPVAHRFVCLTCGTVSDIGLEACHETAERFAGAPTLSAVAEIARTTDQEPEDVVRTLLELGLRVLGRTDRSAYFEGRRLWEALTYGSEA